MKWSMGTPLVYTESPQPMSEEGCPFWNSRGAPVGWQSLTTTSALSLPPIRCQCLRLGRLVSPSHVPSGLGFSLAQLKDAPSSHCPDLWGPSEMRRPLFRHQAAISLTDPPGARLSDFLNTCRGERVADQSVYTSLRPSALSYTEEHFQFGFSTLPDAHPKNHTHMFA